MSYFKAKMHKIRFRLGELTALPQTPQLDLRGPTSKSRRGNGRGKGCKATEWDEDGMEREGLSPIERKSGYVPVGTDRKQKPMQVGPVGRLTVTWYDTRCQGIAQFYLPPTRLFTYIPFPSQVHQGPLYRPHRVHEMRAGYCDRRSRASVTWLSCANTAERTEY